MTNDYPPSGPYGREPEPTTLEIPIVGDQTAPALRRELRQIKKKRKGRRIVGWIAFALAVILVVVGGYGVYNYFHFTNGVSKISGAIPGFNGKDIDGKAQNILLVGNDERPANMTEAEYKDLSTTEDGGSSNTDTMILLHVPADGSSATMISFPRDSYVNIPGHGMNKLNAAFVLGKISGGSDAAGAKLLIQTIQNLTGLTVDHYVQVSLLGFYTIAKALGPVTVCLNEATQDSYSGANFTKGENTLDAKQALEFVRQRHGLPGGDLDRVKRQQYFLSVEAQQILSAGTLLNPIKLNKSLSAISGSVTTDSGLNLLSLAKQMRGLKGGNIASTTIPLGNPETETIQVGGAPLSIVNIDTAAIPQFVDQLINGSDGPSSAYKKATAAAPSTVTVAVLNGAGTAHGASDAIATLKAAGFQTGAPQDASTSQATTTIYYPSGQEAGAKALAEYVPGAQVVQSSSYTQVTLILGTDGKVPSSQATPGALGTSTTSSGLAAMFAAPKLAASADTNSYSSKTCVN